MLFQLPNGKTISISISQYLAMDDSIIQELVASGCGSVASSPWCSSAIKKPGKYRVKDEDEDDYVTEGLSEEELDLDDPDEIDEIGLGVDGEFDTPEPEE